jgi:transposase
MIEAHGIAAGTAAEMLLLVGDNPDRIRSEAAFAKLCGACPIPASSGKTTRHRLNRGGNRQANAARTAGSSSACAATSQPSTTSGDARPKERKMEIIRCLKRFMAREIFGYLCREPKLPLVAQSDP